MATWQDILDAYEALGGAITDHEIEMDEETGATAYDVLESPREHEIERLRAENLALRDTIRKQADEIKRLKAGAQRRLL